MSSVDTVLVGNVDASTFLGTLNLVSATGTTAVGFSNTVAASLTNIINAATTATITLDNADGTGNQRVNLGASTGRTGTTDAFGLTIQGGSGTSTAFADFGLITNAAAADATFEVANITVGAGAANFVNFGTGGANITTVNVSGAGTPSTSTTFTGQVLALTEAANFANVTTINASGLTTGGLNIATTLAQNVTFTGSGFNDRLNVTGGVGNITGADTINFGTGTLDTLAIGTTVDFRAVTLGTASTALINAITTADNLEASTAGAVQIRMADWTTINTFTLSGATAGVASTNNAAITGLETADTLRVTGDIRTIGAAGAAGAAGANAGTAGTAGVDSLLLGGQAVGQTANLVFTGGIDLTATGGAGGAGGAGSAGASTGGAGAAGGAGASAIDVANGGANIGTLNISSIGTSANTLIGGTGGAGGAGGTAGNAGTGGAAGAGGAGAVAIDNGAGLTQLNITGTADLTIAGGVGGAAGAAGVAGAGGTNGATAAAGASAAGFSSAINVNASTFTGVLTVSGSTAADSLTGGSNNDIITTLGGLDSLTGGAGTDDFRINGTAVTSATAFITVTDFNAGDQISILSQVRAGGGALIGGGTALNGTAVFNSTAINVSTAANFAGALDLASALAGNANTQVTWFNWTDGNTYVVVDNTVGATYTAATDAVIQLTGVKTLTVGSIDFA